VILANGATLEIGQHLLASPFAVAVETPIRERAASGNTVAVATPATQSKPSLEAVERDYILDVLRQTNWLITGPRGAAKVLGLHPSTLRYRMKKLGIARTDR